MEESGRNLFSDPTGQTISSLLKIMDEDISPIVHGDSVGKDG